MKGASLNSISPQYDVDFAATYSRKQTRLAKKNIQDIKSHIASKAKAARLVRNYLRDA